MFRINKVIDEESLILKEDEPITLTEVGTGIKRKLLLEDKETEHPTLLTEEFFDIIICLTSITRRLTQQIMYSDKDAEVIETQKQLIIQAIAIITDTLNLKTIIEGYFDVGENLTYEKTKEIATDLTRIENALDNIGTTLSEELKNNLIYKE